MEKRAQEVLESLSVTTLRSVRQTVAGLSGGQRQAVAVPRPVMWDSRLIILDEPTAALGVAQTRQVLDLVRRLAEQGYAVVIISHNLHDIFEVSQRITVLRLGQQVAVFDRATTTQLDVVHAITAGGAHPRAGHGSGGHLRITTHDREETAADAPEPARRRRGATLARSAPAETAEVHGSHRVARRLRAPPVAGR